MVKVSADAKAEEITEKAKENADISKYITGEIVKTIYVPKKILNLIVK